ncbi:hypothetical protein M885DRAFT_321809 [Pelagophyceae sp. CCMP2097]|nr:hypothetical protein M885DRAFT_321809 [Pelagophyceae sp. CCMP2097]
MATRSHSVLVAWARGSSYEDVATGTFCHRGPFRSCRFGGRPASAQKGAPAGENRRGCLMGGFPKGRLCAATWTVRELDHGRSRLNAMSAAQRQCSIRSGSLEMRLRKDDPCWRHGPRPVRRRGWRKALFRRREGPLRGVAATRGPLGGL